MKKIILFLIISFNFSAYSQMQDLNEQVYEWAEKDRCDGSCVDPFAYIKKQKAKLLDPIWNKAEENREKNLKARDEAFNFGFNSKLYDNKSIDVCSDKYKHQFTKELELACQLGYWTAYFY